MSLRVFVPSNAPWSASGYGTQTKGLSRHLSRLGHEVGIHGWFGLQGGVIQATEDNVPIYPRYKHPYGGDIMGAHARDFDADIVLTLIDIWIYHDQPIPQSLPCPWMPWFPIDSHPAAPPIVEVAKRAHYPVIYSRHGERMMTEAGVDVTYIPHGIDTDMFSPGDRTDARESLGWPQESFIVSMVAANKGFPARKAFPECLEAFARFRETHDDALLYLHTNVDAEEGLDFQMLMDSVGVPAEVVTFVPNYAYIKGLSEEYVTSVYRASDVLLSPSYGEGFGLTLAEGQACGTPVITQDCSSMPELTCNGIVIERGKKLYMPIGQYYYMPRVDAIVDALEQVYDWSEDERQAKRDAGVEFVRSEYDWTHVADTYWQPFLERVEGELW